jgi:hypothetical protein
VTEHIASEMRLILRSDKGKAGVLYRACLDLPSAACPPSRPSAHSRMAWPGLASTEADPEARRGPCLRALAWSDTPPTLPTSRGRAEQRSRQSPHTLVLAHASARTGMGLCGNVCRVRGLPGVKLDRLYRRVRRCAVCVRSPRLYVATQCNTVDQMQRVASQHDTSQCRHTDKLGVGPILPRSRLCACASARARSEVRSG